MNEAYIDIGSDKFYIIYTMELESLPKSTSFLLEKLDKKFRAEI